MENNDVVFTSKEEQLKDIVKQINSVGKIADAKNNSLIVSSDDEGKPLKFLKKLKMSGAINSVGIKDGKLDIELNENFFGTIAFCGDLTSYKRYRIGDKLAIERPYGNEIIIDVFEGLLEKIKEHNKIKEKEKQIKFVAVPGNHEFLVFQGNEDNYAIMDIYKNYKIDPIDKNSALKTKLRGVKVIADIQKYYLEQVKENGEEKDIVDDDYGDGETKIGDKIENLNNYIKKVQGVIDDVKSNNMEHINEDIQLFQDDYSNIIYSINDLNLKKLDVFQWNKTPLLSKIVFCHNGKKFRILHSFALFADYEVKITSENQQQLFEKNLNDNKVDIEGVNKKWFPFKEVFKDNKITTFVGHEGARDVSEQTCKVFCVDTTAKRYMMFIVDKENKIQGYDLDTGEKVKAECKKMETYDIKLDKMKNILNNKKMPFKSCVKNAILNGVYIDQNGKFVYDEDTGDVTLYRNNIKTKEYYDKQVQEGINKMYGGGIDNKEGYKKFRKNYKQTLKSKKYKGKECREAFEKQVKEHKALEQKERLKSNIKWYSADYNTFSKEGTKIGNIKI